MLRFMVRFSFTHIQYLSFFHFSLTHHINNAISFCVFSAICDDIFDNFVCVVCVIVKQKKSVSWVDKEGGFNKKVNSISVAICL